MVGRKRFAPAELPKASLVEIHHESGRTTSIGVRRLAHCGLCAGSGRLRGGRGGPATCSNSRHLAARLAGDRWESGGRGRCPKDHRHQRGGWQIDHRGRGIVGRAKITIDPACKPKSIDMLTTEGRKRPGPRWAFTSSRKIPNGFATRRQPPTGPPSSPRRRAVVTSWPCSAASIAAPQAIAGHRRDLSLAIVRLRTSGQRFAPEVSR